MYGPHVIRLPTRFVPFRRVAINSLAFQGTNSSFRTLFRQSHRWESTWNEQRLFLAQPSIVSSLNGMWEACSVHPSLLYRWVSLSIYDHTNSLPSTHSLTMKTRLLVPLALDGSVSDFFQFHTLYHCFLTSERSCWDKRRGWNMIWLSPILMLPHSVWPVPCNLCHTFSMSQPD